MSVHLQRCTPAFWRTQYHHGPAWSRGNARLPAFFLMGLNFGNATLKRRRHRLMHAVVIGSVHEVRIPAIPAEQIFQFLMSDPRQQSRVVDLVSVKVKYR